MADVAVAQRSYVDERLQRWLPIAAGGAVAAIALYQALHRRHNGGRGGKGTGMIARQGSDTRDRLSGHRGSHVEASVAINRRSDELYRFWRDFENLPKFMKHLETVAVRDEGVSHWIAKGPAGTHVEWDARIINDIDGRLIAWQSLRGSQVATAGSVHFEETPSGSTEVRVHFQYRPPAGKLGSAIAYVFGEEPRLQVREDLDRFKRLMETGQINAD